MSPYEVPTNRLKVELERLWKLYRAGDQDLEIFHSIYLIEQILAQRKT